MLKRSWLTWKAPYGRGISLALGLMLVGLTGGIAEAQTRTQQCITCPPGYRPVSPGSMTPGSTMPADPNAPAPDPNAVTDPNAAANDPNNANNQMLQPDQVFNQPNNAVQTASNTSSSAPNTIGDFFGTVPTSTQIFSPLGSVGSLHPVNTVGPYAELGGRQKFVEHESALPRDRVFLNYSYFDNVPLSQDGNNVNRFTPGVEKTFFDGMASVTVRVPMWTTLSSDIYTGTSPSDENYEFGNINIGAKLLLAQTDTFAMSIGTTVKLPTADDIRIFAEDTGVEVARYENQSVHVLPYLAMVFTPTDRLFSQVIFQLDFDTNGNPVKIINGGGSLEQVGRANDANFAYVSWSAGYWLIKHEHRCGGVEHGLAPMVELHYNRTIRDFDKLVGETSDGVTDFAIGTNVPGDVGAREIGGFEALNLVLGLHLQATRDASVTLGYAAPLAGMSRNDQFNGEFRALFNYAFGSSGRQ